MITRLQMLLPHMPSSGSARVLACSAMVTQVWDKFDGHFK
ncbi:hypothetical protein EDD90_2069 [Streptomyces sp. Ag109_O5-1]|nr:hypothetical protein EDD90_2069 [Streptomyces sp. Ag109_O5-1]